MKYIKPTVNYVDGVSEGIYMASGSINCYTVSARIHQTPETGRGDYRIQVDGIHKAMDGHHSGTQLLILNFNQPVTYVDSQGTLINGDGTSSISIKYRYHNNGSDNIGLGDVIVSAEPGLAITGCTLDCNHGCGQH